MDKVFYAILQGCLHENYADFLASTVEANKDSFSEEEYKTLSKDIEKIRGIEDDC